MVVYRDDTPLLGLTLNINVFVEILRVLESRLIQDFASSGI